MHINAVPCLQVTLKLDPETEIKKFGPKPGPLDEVEVCSIIIKSILGLKYQVPVLFILFIKYMNLVDLYSLFY